MLYICYINLNSIDFYYMAYSILISVILLFVKLLKLLQNIIFKAKVAIMDIFLKLIFPKKKN